MVNFKTYNLINLKHRFRPGMSRAPMFFLSQIYTIFATVYANTYNNAIYYTFICRNV